MLNNQYVNAKGVNQWFQMHEVKYFGNIRISYDTLFVFFDVETVEVNEYMHVSVLSYISYHYNTDVIVESNVLVNEQFVDGVIDDDRIIMFSNEDELVGYFTDYLIKMTEFFKNVIVVSHNLHFDRIGINFDKLFQVFDVDYYNIDRNMFMRLSRRFNGRVRYLILNDNINYYPLPLNVIGEAFGIEKLSVDDYGVVNTNLIEYNIRDVRILMESHLYVVKRVVEELGDEKYFLTISSIAYALLMNKYLPDGVKIYTHHIPEIEKMELSSLRGGRNENRVMGIVRERIYKLDVNSQYPYQMITKKLPLYLSEYYDFESGVMYLTILSREDGTPSMSMFPLNNVDPMELLNKLLSNDKLFIVDGVFDIDDDVVCSRCIIGDGVVEPYGDVLESDVCVSDPYDDKSHTHLICAKFFNVRMVLTSVELREFMDHVRVKKVNRIAVYEGGYPTKRFVAKFYGERILSKIKGDYVNDLFNKLMLNTLSGKFSQRISIKVPIDDVLLPSNVDIDTTVIYDLSSGVKVESLFGKHFIVDEERVVSQKSFPAISSFITAYGRVYLTKLIKLVEGSGGKVFYYDTDSLHVDEVGFRVLQKYGFIARRYEIGKLKIEGVYDGGIYLTNKQYVLFRNYDSEHYEAEFVFSGIPLKMLYKYLSDRGLISNPIGVTDYVDYYMKYRKFDFPILVRKGDVDDLFISLLNYEIVVDRLTKTKSSIRKYGGNVVKVEKFTFRRNRLKYKRRYIRGGKFFWVSEPYCIDRMCESRYILFT